MIRSQSATPADVVLELYRGGNARALVRSLISAVNYEDAEELFGDSVVRVLSGSCPSSHPAVVHAWIAQDMRFRASHLRTRRQTYDRLLTRTYRVEVHPSAEQEALARMELAEFGPYELAVGAGWTDRELADALGFKSHTSIGIRRDAERARRLEANSG